MRLALLAALLLTGEALAQKKPRKPPTAGTVFHVAPDKPGWATADVEFRDPSDELWPNLFFGKPGSKGTFTFDPVKPSASFVMKCDQQAQRNGDQSRRVLGPILGPRGNAALVTVKSLGAWATETREEVDRKGKKKTVKVEYCPVELAVEVAGKPVEAKGKATVRWGYPKDAELPDSAYVEIAFDVPGSALGAKPETVRCRAGVTAYAAFPKK